LLGIGSCKRRHHRDLIDLEQTHDLNRVEPVAALGERRRNDLPGRVGIRHELSGHRRRDLRQCRHDLAMPCQVHEPTHRIVFGRVVRNPRAAQHVDDFLVRPDQNREHRFG
jgi:hypothetical protein